MMDYSAGQSISTVPIKLFILSYEALGFQYFRSLIYIHCSNSSHFIWVQLDEYPDLWISPTEEIRQFNLHSKNKGEK